jgi:hypothetical protein
VLRWYEREDAAAGLAAAAGALVAAAVLVKLTNAAVLAVAAAAVALRGWRDGWGLKALSRAWPLVVSAALPLILWGLRNRVVLGDWTGTATKRDLMTWTPKPLTELLDHPLFTAHGAGSYLYTLCISLFGGDSIWHGRAVHFLPSEYFFLATSALVPAAGLVSVWRRSSQEPRAVPAAGSSALLIAAYLAGLTALSLRWDFGQSTFPSRQFPFFAFGRLLAGALVPYLALYALGLRGLVGRRPVLFGVAIAVAVTMMILGQWAYVRQTVSSEFNWFHLP